MTDDQKASVYHVATAGVRFRIQSQRIFQKYFKIFLESGLKHHKMTIYLQDRWDLWMFQTNFVAVQVINTYQVAVPIRTVQTTQFHFVINMCTNSYHKATVGFVINFCSFMYRDNLGFMVGWVRALVQTMLEMPKV